MIQESQILAKNLDFQNYDSKKSVDSGLTIMIPKAQFWEKICISKITIPKKSGFRYKNQDFGNTILPKNLYF